MFTSHFTSSLNSKYRMLSIIRSYKHSSNFLHNTLLQSTQIIIDRLPKNFNLIAGDLQFCINKKIISALSPLINEKLNKDKEFDTFKFKKPSHFSAFPAFCSLLKGEEVSINNQLLISLRKLLKELQITISLGAFLSIPICSHKVRFDQNIIPKNNILCISYSNDFFKQIEKKIIIKTRSYIYECYAPYIYVSNLLYRKFKDFIERNENQKDDELYTYFYDADDDEAQFKKIFTIFSGYFRNNSKMDYKLLLKVANDFEITFLPKLIQELTERRAFIDKKFLEYDFSESETLMHRLFTFKIEDIDDLLNYLKKSKWMSDNDYLKELAYYISYIASIRLDRILPLCYLSNRIGFPFLNYLHYILYHRNNEYSKFKSSFQFHHQPSCSLTNNFFNELYSRKILMTKSKFMQHAKIPIFAYKFKERMHHGYGRTYKNFTKYNQSQQIKFQFNNNEDIFKRIIYLDDVNALKSNFDIQIFSPKSSKLDTNYFQFSIICGSVKCFNFLKSLNIYDIGPNELSFAIQSGNTEITNSIYNDPSLESNIFDPLFNFPRKYYYTIKKSNNISHAISYRKIDEIVKDGKINQNNDKDENLQKKEKSSLSELQSENIIMFHNRDLYDEEYIKSHSECLVYAIRSNNFEVVRMCKDMIADLNYTPILEDLILNGFFDMFFFILSLQPDVEKALNDLKYNYTFEENPNLMYFAATTGNVRLMRFLYENEKKSHLNNKNENNNNNNNDIEYQSFGDFDFDLIFSIAVENFDLETIKFIVLECNYKPPYDALANAIKITFLPGKTSFVEFFYNEKLTHKAWLPAILEILATGYTESSFQLLKEVSHEIQMEKERIKKENENKEKTQNNNNENEINYNDDDDINNIINDNDNDNNSDNDFKFLIKNLDSAFERAFVLAVTYGRKNNVEFLSKFNLDEIEIFRLDSIIQYGVRSCHFRSLYTYLKSIHNDKKRLDLVKTGLRQAFDYNRHQAVRFFILFDPSILKDVKILIELMIHGYTNSVINTILRKGHVNIKCRQTNQDHDNTNESKSENQNENSKNESKSENSKNESKSENQNENSKNEFSTPQNSNNESKNENQNESSNNDSKNDNDNANCIGGKEQNSNEIEFKEIDFMQKIDLTKLDFTEIDQYIIKTITLKNRDNESIFRLLISTGLFNLNNYLEKTIEFFNYKAFKILLEYSTPRNPIMASSINNAFYFFSDYNSYDGDPEVDPLNSNSNSSNSSNAETSTDGENFSTEKNISDKNIEVNVTDPYGLNNCIFPPQYYNDFSFSSISANGDILITTTGNNNNINDKNNQTKKKSKNKNESKHRNFSLFTMKDDSDLKKIFNNKKIDEDEIIKLFLDFEGIDVNYTIESTPLIITATINKRVKIVKALASHPDIDINATDKDALTAIMHAARIGNREIFDILYYNNEININKLTFMNRSTLSFAVLGLPEVVPLILSNDNIKKLGNDQMMIHFDHDKSHAEVAAAAAFSKNNFEIFSLILKSKFDINRRFSIRSKNYFLESNHSGSSKKKLIRQPWNQDFGRSNDKPIQKDYSERNLLEIISIFGQSFSIPFLKLLVNHPCFVEIGNKIDSLNGNDKSEFCELPVLPSDIVDAAILKAAKNPYQNAEIMMNLLHLGGHDVNYSVEKTPLIVFAAYNNNTSLVKKIIESPDYDVGHRKLREKPLVYKKRKKTNESSTDQNENSNEIIDKQNITSSANDAELNVSSVKSFDPRFYFSAQTHAAFCISLYMCHFSVAKLLIDLVDVNDYAPSDIHYPCSSHRIDNHDRDFHHKSSRFFPDDYSLDLFDMQLFDDYNNEDDDFDFILNDSFNNERKFKYGFDSKLRVVKISDVNGIRGINGIDSSNINSITKILSNNDNFNNNVSSSINLAGKTPLTLALASGKNFSYQILEKKEELDFNKPNKDGSHPVFYAIKMPALIHEMAASESFDVNVTDSKGETIIMKLLRSDDLKNALLLLSKDNIDLLKVDNRGNSVRSILEKKGVDTSELGENPTNNEILDFVKKICI